MRRAAVLFVACLTLAGCGGNKALTKENFDKIQPNMTLAEVQTLLGGPGEENPDGLGLGEGSSVAGAAGVGGTLDSMTAKKSNVKWYKWGGSSKWIAVAFLDGKVAASNSKRSEGLR